MNTDLIAKALKLYGDKFGVRGFTADYVSYSFIPLFKRWGYVWVHVSSVVRYCHITNPEEFSYLNTRSLFHSMTTKHEVINNSIATRSFRLIEINHFEAITGIKV